MMLDLRGQPLYKHWAGGEVVCLGRPILQLDAQPLCDTANVYFVCLSTLAVRYSCQVRAESTVSHAAMSRTTRLG